MTFGSLFAGIGGLDLGLVRSGMQCIWQVENDSYAVKVLEKHWPDVHREKDVRDCGKHNLEMVDLIAGGPPCQPVSIAGKRKGSGDPRWLWPEFARVINELEPRYVLIENTPGILSRGMGDILCDLSKSGYDAEWDDLPAGAFGAWHIRERIFIFAYRAGEDDGEITPESIKRQEPEFGEGPLVEVSTDAAGIKPGFFSQAFQAWKSELGECYWSTGEPELVGMVHGIPHRLHRHRGLGNAVVPIVAQYIGERILEWDLARTHEHD